MRFTKSISIIMIVVWLNTFATTAKNNAKEAAPTYAANWASLGKHNEAPANVTNEMATVIKVVTSG